MCKKVASYYIVHNEVNLIGLDKIMGHRNDERVLYLLKNKFFDLDVFCVLV